MSVFFCSFASLRNAVQLVQRFCVLSMCVASHIGPSVGWCVAIACRLYQRRIGAFRKTRFCLHVRGQLRVNKFHNSMTYLLSKNIADIPEDT